MGWKTHQSGRCTSEYLKEDMAMGRFYMSRQQTEEESKRLGFSEHQKAKSQTNDDSVIR